MWFNKSKSIFALLFSGFFLLVSLNASAFQDDAVNKYQCKVISKNQAIINAKRRMKGKIVAVNLVKKGSRSVYKVRMLINKKRVKTITIPACQ